MSTHPSAGTCKKCGHALGHYRKNLSGLCKRCYVCRHGGRHGRHLREKAVCYCCRQLKPCPIDKDPRWFICDDCRKNASEGDGAERWLDGAGADIHALLD